MLKSCLAGLGGVAVALLLALGVALVAYAEDRPLGMLSADASTPVNNATTAIPFSLPRGALVYVQCNASAWVQAFSSDAGAVQKAALGDGGVTGLGVLIPANGLYPVQTLFWDGTRFISMVCDTASTCTCAAMEHVQ